MGVEDPKGSTGSPASNTTGESSTPLLQPQLHHYGTFQGVACYSQPPRDHTVVGFPPPPPTVTAPSSYYYPHGYQAVAGYVVADGRPLRESEELCCCGIGLGWILFVAGFFFAALPWYIGALVLLCGSVDYREKPGLVACTIATVLSMIAIVFGVTGGAESW